MFKNAKVVPSFSVSDTQKAKKFYHETLDLNVKEQPEGLELQIAGGTRVFVYPKQNHEPASFTILNFPVNNIDQAVDELKQRGVRFEHYDSEPIKTDEKGICRTEGASIAWFKDPAGNILSVLEEAA